MVYILKDLIRFRRHFLWVIILEVIVGVLVTYAGLVLTQSVVSMVTSNTNTKEIILVTLSLVGLLGLLLFILLILNVKTALYRQTLRTSRLFDIMHQITHIDYQQIETDEYRQAQEKAVNTVQSDASLFQVFPLNLSKFLRSLIQILLLGSLLSILNPLFLVLIIVLLVLIIIYRYFQQRYVNSTKAQHAQYNSQLSYINRVSSNFSLAKDIRLFNVNPWFVNIFNEVLSKSRKLTFKRLMFNFGGQILSGIFILLLQGLGYWVLLKQYLSAQITIGQLTFFIGAITTIAANSSEFVNLVFDLIDNSVDISNLRHFENYPKVFNHHSNKALPTQIESIEFKDVSFGYPNTETKLFNNFNLKIEKNEKVAIVGLNGAGKTTLIKLLCNLYKPDSGQILINGQDNQSFNVNDYYQLFSVVFQNSYTLPISVKDTIIQSNEFNAHKFESVLDKSNLKNTIDNFDKKEDSLLVKEVYPEGLTLSGGQHQKLKMAQALYKDAPILVLDEPTSALDPLAESEVYQQYYQNSYNKISLFVTHRLATTQFCDRIIYIENGQIIEDGSHQELLNKKEKYYEMYQKQSYYYQRGELQ